VGGKERFCDGRAWVVSDDCDDSSSASYHCHSLFLLFATTTTSTTITTGYDEGPQYSMPPGSRGQFHPSHQALYHLSSE